MSLLTRFGLSPRGPRIPRRAGLRLDSRTPEASGAPSNRWVAERLGLLGVLVAIALLAFPNVSVTSGLAQVEAGDVWKGADLVAPFDFAIRLPDDVFAARADSVRRSEPVVFSENAEALPQTLARLDSLDARLDAAAEAYAAWQSAREAAQVAVTPEARAEAQVTARTDSARFEALRTRFDLSLSPSQWGILMSSSYAVETGRDAPPSLGTRLGSEAARVARDLLPRGLANVPRDSLRMPTLLVRNLDPRVRTEDERPSGEVYASDEALAAARVAFAETFPGRPDTVDVATVLFQSAVEPSLVYLSEVSTRRRADAVADLLPTSGRIREGMTVIRRGDEVTPERFDRLRSLDLAQRDRSGASWAQTIAGRLGLVSSALVLFFLYLYLLRPALFGDLRRLLLVSLIVGGLLVGFWIAGVVGGASRYGVPVALGLTLLTISFDSRVSSFAGVTVALLGGLVFGYDFEFTFATLVVGILAVFSVRDVRNRSQLVATAGLVLMVYAVILTSAALLRADPFSTRLTAEFVAVAVHAVLILLAAPLLWGIERTFGVTTDLTLLELSDTNRPLLKDLSLRAPGTFSHALQVANLAEAAADAVGANALRARVGALYHDIGKTLKPDYFVENQSGGANPHDDLKPSVSALVLAAHVRDGIELGRQNGLPQVVLDFIATHHGTSTMDFFYRRAVERRGPEEPPVAEAEFRYPGPRPQTVEQAIVMLADSVEAASRSLDRPTPRRLESLIESIVSSRIADGQLDESGLTFQDVARVKETFLSLLCGVYHFRIRYPGQASEGPDEAAPSVEPPTLIEELDPEKATPEERATLG